MRKVLKSAKGASLGLARYDFDFVGLLIEYANLLLEFIRGFNQFVRDCVVKTNLFRPGTLPGFLRFGSLKRGNSPKDECVIDVIRDHLWLSAPLLVMML
jgi:hypothetical protein